MLKKVFLLFFLFSNVAHAKSVILMIGDGMGYNHISCVAKDNDLFLAKHTANSSVITESADDIITDSAAAATAYACGIKTKNRFLGIDAQKNKCETIAEKAMNNNKNVFIISTDNEYGATPSSFPFLLLLKRLHPGFLHSPALLESMGCSASTVAR